MSSRIARSIFGLVASSLLAAGSAWAVPVDLADPTLRNIRIELESSPCDPAGGDINDCRIMASDPGAVFGTVLTGSFEIVAGEAIVTIAAADWEQVLFGQQGMGSLAPDVAGVLPGTTSDAVLRFDAVTGLPSAWDWSALLHFFILGTWFDIPLTGQIASSPNDVYFTTFFGTPLALNCVAAGGPAPLPGECLAPSETHLAYNPATGTVTALGAVANGLVRPAWAPADWRLSEVPEPKQLLLFSLGALGLVEFGRRRGSRSRG